MNFNWIVKFLKNGAFQVLGFLLSLVAVWFAWSANDMARQQNEKTTDPFLILEVEKIPSTDPQQHEFGLYYKNVGLGPAFILGFEAYKNEKPVAPFFPTNGHDLAASFGLKNNATTRDEMRQGQVIPVGGRITIFRVTRWNDVLSPAEFSDLVEAGLREHAIATCYASVYAERKFGLFGRGLNAENVRCAKGVKVNPGYPLRVQFSPSD